MPVDLLDLVIFVPFIGFLLLLMVPKDKPGMSRVLALALAGIEFVLSVGLVAPYWFQQPPGYTFVTDSQWISTPPIRYHVGLDGISLPLFELTLLLSFLCAVYTIRFLPAPGRPFDRISRLREGSRERATEPAAADDADARRASIERAPVGRSGDAPVARGRALRGVGDCPFQFPHRDTGR